VLASALFAVVLPAAIGVASVATLQDGKLQ
jgi:hypothetical protein